jgi:adenylylsulfate kinase
LPASGKTTIAKALEEALEAQQIQTMRLDGDESRRTYCKDLGFSPQERAENIWRNAHICSFLVYRGHVVICAFISPYKDGRDHARRVVPNFLEVFVRCPLWLCEQRDNEAAQRGERKGFYKLARSGKKAGFTGIDAPYEEPERPELVLRTDQLSVEESVDQIIGSLRHRGFLP